MKPPTSTSRLNFEFFLANLANLLVLTGSVMFVLLPEYLQSKQLDKSQIGLIDGSFWLISVVVQPWLGARLDKDGRKVYLASGALLMACAAFSYAYVPVAFVPMLVARIIHGFGFACYLTSSWTWVADFAPPSRVSEYFGIFGICGMLAGAVGPAFAEQIVLRQGYDGLFTWGSLTIFLGALLLLTLSDRKPLITPHTRPRGFFRILASKDMRGPVIGCIAFGLAVGSLFAFIAPYLSFLKIQGVGPIFAATALASGASRVYAGKQSHLGPAQMVGPSLFLLAIGCLGLAVITYAPGYAMTLLIASGLTAGLGYGVIYPALNAVAVERLDAATRGRGLSLVTASIDTGSFAGAAIAGEIIHQAGFPAGFLGVSCLLLLFWLAFWWIEHNLTHQGSPIKPS